MKVNRLETVVQFVADPERSKDWYRDLLGIEPTPYEGPYFKFDEHAYLILAQASPGTGRGGSGVWFEVHNVDDAYAELKDRYTFNEAPFDIPPGRLVTLNDLDGNVIGLIDNTRGGMPGQT
jgi:catechol 2,3-dioxygenase-like lactoylglutathione lyase family enzyme